VRLTTALALALALPLFAQKIFPQPLAQYLTERQEQRLKAARFMAEKGDGAFFFCR